MYKCESYLTITPCSIAISRVLMQLQATIALSESLGDFEGKPLLATWLRFLQTLAEVVSTEDELRPEQLKQLKAACKQHQRILGDERIRPICHAKDYEHIMY